jgi:hypothetical protein
VKRGAARCSAPSCSASSGGCAMLAALSMSMLPWSRTHVPTKEGRPNVFVPLIKPSA